MAEEVEEQTPSGEDAEATAAETTEEEAAVRADETEEEATLRALVAEVAQKATKMAISACEEKHERELLEKLATIRDECEVVAGQGRRLGSAPG